MAAVNNPEKSYIGLVVANQSPPLRSDSVCFCFLLYRQLMILLNTISNLFKSVLTLNQSHNDFLPCIIILYSLIQVQIFFFFSTNYKHLLKTWFVISARPQGLNEGNIRYSTWFTARCFLSPSSEPWWCPLPTSFPQMWCWCQLASMLWKDTRHHWEATRSRPSVRLSQPLFHMWHTFTYSQTSIKLIYTYISIFLIFIHIYFYLRINIWLFCILFWMQCNSSYQA